MDFSTWLLFLSFYKLTQISLKHTVVPETTWCFHERSVKMKSMRLHLPKPFTWSGMVILLRQLWYPLGKVGRSWGHWVFLVQIVKCISGRSSSYCRNKIGKELTIDNLWEEPFRKWFFLAETMDWFGSVQLHTGLGAFLYDWECTTRLSYTNWVAFSTWNTAFLQFLKKWRYSHPMIAV